jgi:hypothetical protein
MKAKISKFANLGLVKTAVLTGTFAGKAIEVGVTSTNTTWRTVFGGIDPKNIKKGFEFELDDDLIQESAVMENGVATDKKTGRYFIQRVKVEKFEEAARMAIAEQSLINAGF